MDQNQQIYQKRQEKLAQTIQSAGLEALALNPGPSLVYLTGLHFHLSERPVIAAFAASSTPVIILPELEAAKVQALGTPMQAFLYGEDPAAWPGAFKKGLETLGLAAGARLGVEPRQMRVLELRLLEAALPKASLVSGDSVLSPLRMSKDAFELDNMRKAVEIAQQALLATLPSIRIGMSEKELAAELVLQLLRHGSDSEIPFQPIVSGGPNSANPHAVPSSRLLQRGDLLVIDWGASWNGYFSDLTRTFAVGEAEAELQHIAQVVLAANRAGRGAARPGAACGDVDAAARSVIDAAGYGQYFTHRTGHGLGMEGHEEPYMRKDNAMPLAPGMTFTVEPGIYLPGRNGVRIEDNLVVTADSAETLSSLPRELLTVG